MLTIKVLGPNSPYTDKLDQYTRAALRMLNPHCACELIRINDDEAIREYTDKVPALVINDTVVAEGAIPAPQLIVTWVSDVLQDVLVETASAAYATEDALAPAAR